MILIAVMAATIWPASAELLRRRLVRFCALDKREFESPVVRRTGRLAFAYERSYRTADRCLLDHRLLGRRLCCREGCARCLLAIAPIWLAAHAAAVPRPA